MKFATLLPLVALASAAPLPHSLSGLSALIPKFLPAFTRAQCDLSSATLPVSGNTPILESPTSTIKLSMVLVGHGTQNYTCDPAAPSATPAAAGAVATLYNASCIAASQPAMLSQIVAASKDVPASQLRVMPSVGKHYFMDATTPTFDVQGMGVAYVKKNGSSPAPKSDRSPKDVPWLFLDSKVDINKSKVKAIYRVNTVGGSAPESCVGQPAKFEVKYAAEYWFFEG